MKVVIIAIIALLMTNMAYAESLKDRVRRARQQEAEISKPTPIVAAPQEVSPALPQSTMESVPVAPCADEIKTVDGVTYHKECYCKGLKYPEVEAVLKGHGLIYESRGIKELGDGATHNDPAQRVNYHYTCGVKLMWEPTNQIQFPNVNACYDFVDKIAIKFKDKIWFFANPLYYGCGKHVPKVENTSTP